jgi:hypothetical protein
MRCEHHGFHTITSSYDRETRILTYFRLCEECGARLAEVDRLAYEPKFDPAGAPGVASNARSPAVAEAGQVERWAASRAIASLPQNPEVFSAGGGA